MPLEIFSLSDPGMARGNNEDAVAQDERTGIVILADGMGGYNAGEVASQMVTSFVVAELGRWLAQATEMASESEVRRAMQLCVGNANRAVYNAATSHRQYAGMGTTVVLAVFRPGRVLIGHVGDSRAYRWRAGALAQLSKDHSLLQEQIDAGLLTREQARHSMNRNLVTRAVGVESHVDLEVHAYDVEPEDCYLLCSDGLNDMVEDEEVAAILASSADLPQAAEALIGAANAAGGRDNVSVSLVRVTGAEASRKSWWSRMRV